MKHNLGVEKRPATPALQIDLLVGNLWQQLQSTIILVTHDIDQAVFLGTKIYVMGGKPANIVKEFDVNIPFPRNRETRRSENFLELKNKVEDFMYSL